MRPIAKYYFETIPTTRDIIFQDKVYLKAKWNYI